MKDYFTEGSSGACSWGMGSKQHMGVSKATQRHRSSGWNLSPELILKFSESFERDLVISPWQKRCNNRNHWIWTSKLLFAKFSIEFSHIHPEITCSAFPYRRRKLNKGSRPRPRPRFRRCKARTGSGGSSAVRHEKALAKPSPFWSNKSKQIKSRKVICLYFQPLFTYPTLPSRLRVPPPQDFPGQIPPRTLIFRPRRESSQSHLVPKTAQIRPAISRYLSNKFFQPLLSYRGSDISGPKRPH